MAPIVPLNTDHPDEGSDEDLRGASNGGLPPVAIFVDDESSDSDTESDGHDHEGYELLSQDPEQATVVTALYYDEETICSGTSFSLENSEVVSRNEIRHPSDIPVVRTSSNRPADTPSKNEPCVNEQAVETEPEMDPEHIQKIKDVMKAVTLPACNLPSWTAVVPEDEWKSALLDKLDSKPKTNQCEMLVRGSKSNPDRPSTSGNRHKKDDGSC